MEVSTAYSIPPVSELRGITVRYLTEVETQSIRLKKISLSEERVAREKMHSIFSGNSRETFDLKAGEYMVLSDLVQKEIIMSDTPMEVRTNYDFIRRANGNILIAGFGIGMIVLAIQDNPLVESITIIEKNPEIIDMVASQLPLNSKVKILNADIFDWPAKAQNKKWDCIYFDIWNVVSVEAYEESKILHLKYSRLVNRKNPNFLFDSWRRYDMKRLHLGY